uniref:Cytochrome c oxidase subunit 3 n=1 Tax=Aplidium tabarquensis TaxID=1256662 RepID=A0A024GX59_9ASCI|nr:cytochrome c oxidase subunit III [Aplidium tabarquensis]
MHRTTPFHLVDNSPWPLFTAFVFFISFSNFVFFFKKIFYSFFICFFLFFLCGFFWWKDIIRESSYLGFHNIMVQKNLLKGMVWFISSEIFFFFGFFWTFFHSSLSNSVDLFFMWPPYGIEVLNPISVPLLNTVILLSSGITVTWAHYSLFSGSFQEMYFGLFFTIFLGFFFTLLQYLEYKNMFYMISDSVYGSIFFMATGFHGFHVLVGSFFLLVSLYRVFFGHFSHKQHVGFECSIWYWHFVDVVWIFLYISVYWWGSFF